MKVTTTDRPIYCERCDAELNKDTAVWMELNSHNGLFHKEEGKVPPEESQGWFVFGSACAKTVLNEQGEK